jgi:hypothetical protein
MLLRTIAVMGDQAQRRLLQLLRDHVDDGKRRGVIWTIDRPITEYASPSPVGYSSSFVRHRLSTMRTDLDSFSEAEQTALINHGYCTAEVVLKRQAAGLIRRDTPVQVPYKEWMEEPSLWAPLENSHTRTKFGRS